MKQTLGHLLDQLGPDNKTNGDQFERIAKWWFENDPEYKARFREVWHFLEWDGRWSNADLGTDLIAEDYDGKFWAIQAKGYDEDSGVNFTDMGTFLADSNRKGISYRLLIAATDGLALNAKKVFAGQDGKPVVVVNRSHLEKSEVNWPESLAELDTVIPQPEPKVARPHQQEAIIDMVKSFAE